MSKKVNPINSFYTKVCDGTLAKSLNEMAPVFKKLKPEEFEKWITTGELPALKLSPKEMEVLNGGGSLFYDVFYKIGEFMREHPTIYWAP